MAACPRALRRLLALALLLLPCWALALPVPEPQGLVTDLAGLLSPEAQAQLAARLAAFRAQESTEIAVLTVETLEEETVEDFGIRVAGRWQIGQKGKDNGVLLLVAKKERKIRIEVGRGLEPVITDLLAGRIADQVIRPLFREGRFEEGLTAGVEAIIAASHGVFVAEPGSGKDAQAEDRVNPLSVLLVLLFGLAIIGGISRLLAAGAGAVAMPVAALATGMTGGSLLALALLVPAGALAGL
ncbi:MAG: TPM domain-containing protein, partial [Thermodesulfobacteriota bacterium]